MGRPVYRVQDNEGRGPWKPGRAKLWVDDNTPMSGRPIFEEPGIMDAVRKGQNRKLHLGCAVRSDKMNVWFTDRDIIKLEGLGYKIVDASQCTVLFETDQQLLIGWTLPLFCLPSAKPPTTQAHGRDE